MVRRAQERGHKVTLFNRGRSNVDLFPEVETLTGDRDGKLDALKGRSWDAVIDNSGYVPRQVRDSAALLVSSVGRYLFISTGSVYAYDQDRYDESSPLLPAPKPASEDVDKYYGPLKVLCEDAVRTAYGERSTVLRLHIVAGPGDPTHRFTYWPVRIDKGGEVIAAGDKTAPVQYIDVRDVAAFTIHTLERNVAGTFNLAGPATSSTPMSHFLEQVKAGTRSSATFTWIDLPFLEQQKVRFPLVLSPDRGPMRGLMKISAAKAMAQGLTFRAITETAADTLAWFRSAPASVQDGLKLDLERDARVLREWKARG
jgi:2'-hydroxyisoflavone reductase